MDPATASRLRPTDSQRIARAWEVWRGTGTGLAAWQASAAAPAPWRFAAILLDPPRADAARRHRHTVRQHAARGALDEVRALLALGLDPALPAMRAHGVPELAAHLRGEITLEEAGRRIELVTGTVHQAPGDLVPPPQAGRRCTHAYDPCANSRVMEQFSERITPDSVDIY